MKTAFDYVEGLLTGDDLSNSSTSEHAGLILDLITASNDFEQRSNRLALWHGLARIALCDRTIGMHHNREAIREIPNPKSLMPHLGVSVESDGEAIEALIDFFDMVCARFLLDKSAWEKRFGSGATG